MDFKTLVAENIGSAGIGSAGIGAAVLAILYKVWGEVWLKLIIRTIKPFLFLI